MTESISTLDAALAPIYRVGGRIATSAQRAAFVSFASAGVITAGVGSVIAPAPWWAWALLLLSSAGFFAPGLVLLVFGRSLAQLLLLPAVIADRARIGISSALQPNAVIAGGPFRRLWRFALHLFRMRDVLMESGGHIAQSALLLRLANPVTAVVLLGALGVTAVLVPVALVIFAVALF